MRDVASENMIKPKGIQKEFECISQFGACVREDSLIDLNDWNAPEEVKTNNLQFFLNVDLSIPRDGQPLECLSAGTGSIRNSVASDM